MTGTIGKLVLGLAVKFVSYQYLESVLTVFVATVTDEHVLIYCLHVHY
jgi:hypothetical protein